jgi:outer membrane receptor for ferrienterochelin and colicins
VRAKNLFLPPRAALLFFFIALSSNAAAEEADGNNVPTGEADIAVTVTGTRTEKRLRDSPIVTEIISAKEIENSKAETVVDVLNDYGIVYTGNAMGDYVQMQGMGKGRVLYLVNGRRVAGRIAQRLKGETLPLANVERIEIVRGPQSALYGSDALGGVVNIITKTPPDKVSFSTGFTNRGLVAYDNPDTPQKKAPFDGASPFREQILTAVLGFPLGKTRNSLDFEGGRGDFYYNETKSASILPRYYRGRLGLDSLVTLNSDRELRFGGSALLMRRDDQLTERGSLTRFEYLRADGFAELETGFLDDGVLTVRLYDNYYQRDKDGYSAIFNQWTKGENYENENVASLDALVSYDGFSNLTLSGGVETAYQSITKSNLEGGAAGVDKEALFFQAERCRADLYSLIAGARLERDSRFGFAAAPKVSGMLHFGGGFRAFSGIGLGYRAPDFSDLYLDSEGSMASSTVYGNKDLDPEYCLGLNAGLEYSKGGRFAQVNFYYSELFNEIVSVYTGTEGEMSIYHRENLARSLRTGVDTEGRFEFVKFLFLSAGYSWLFAWDRQTDAEIYPQPNHTVKMKAGVDFKQTGIYSYFQGRYFSRFLDPSRPESRERFILDFYFSIALGKHFRVHTGIENITGETDRIGPDTAQSFSIGAHYVL